jgi:hypothetical protein
MNKNIHIIPTDKPSDLWLMHNKSQGLMQLKTASLLDGIPQHIYITSDEEIKEEFLTKKIYVIDIQNGNIGKLTCKNNFFKGSSKLIEIEWKNKQNIWNYCHIRQIILTTDQDLIKDGVQAIDDEFLEWFVKNPSYENVKVFYDLFEFEKDSSRKQYKIIIPQEEPKQIKCYCGHTITCDCEPLQETTGKKFYESADKVITVEKQETLEEAAEMYIQSKNPQWTPYHKQSFKDGAKWQQERMEEDMINFAHFYFKEEFNLAMMEINKTTKELLSEWFERKRNLAKQN